MRLCGTLTAPCWSCARSKAALEDLRHRPLFTEVRGIGILRSSPKRSSPKFAKEVVINSSFAGCATSSSASMVQLLLKPGRRESSLTPHPAPLTKGGSFYETHHIASGRHGPNPVGGKRGGLGGQQDRH